ncbi:hypothetical protein Gohar_004183 [Gossypium harknessii]|uniref:Uncharacterized protein n=1 Tax=Gossypium harknessii TaxID=34285 RepID=A0A7J9H480_9ROSI|nr:hypothetical protein [Gossypium harknessii]
MKELTPFSLDLYLSVMTFQYGQQAFDATGMPFGSQVIREYSGGTSPEWLHIGSAFERTT